MSEESKRILAEWDCSQHGHIAGADEICRVCGVEDPLMCQVCFVERAKGVASSTLGPLSLAYCQKCLDARADATWLVEFTLAQCGSWAGVADWFKATISVYRDGVYVKAVDAYTEEDVVRLADELASDVSE